MNRIDQAIRDAEGAVDRVTELHGFKRDDGKPLTARQRQIAIEQEIDKLREDKRTCVLMLRALYAWLDGIGDGVPDASALQKEALWRCATITEVLEKVGELR